MLDRAQIAARIPHQGDMCLLEQVSSWDEQRIRALATSHRDEANPLRQGGRLGSANGIEYAAQAMAVHGSLLATAEAPPRQGYLTSVRSVTLHVERLDTCPGPLEIEAERLSGDGNHVLYQFALHHDGQCLLTGRATVVLDASAL